MSLAGDPGIVDEHLDGLSIGFDLFHACRASVEEPRNVPLVDIDAGLGLELLRRLVVAAVVCGNRITGGLQSIGHSRKPMPRVPPCDQRNAGQWSPLITRHARFYARTSTPRFELEVKDVDGRDKPGTAPAT